MIRAVDSVDLRLCVEVNRGVGKANKPFNGLEREGTRVEYAQFFARVLFTCLRLLTNALLVPREQCHVEMAERILAEPTEETVFALCFSLVGQQAVDRLTSTALLPLFLRLCCQQSNGALLPPNEVSRRGAKLQYLVRLSLLSEVIKRHGAERVSFFESNAHLMRSGFNVFTAISEVKTLAMTIANAEGRLPNIVQGADQWEILVDGIRLTRDQLQTAFRV